MTHKIVLPTWDEAIHSIQQKKGTSLDYFIYDYEPPGYSEREKFRESLEKALQYAIDEQESFGLTLDGAELGTPEASKHAGHDFQRRAMKHKFCSYCGEPLLP